jgi:hypothetical protein
MYLKKNYSHLSSEIISSIEEMKTDQIKKYVCDDFSGVYVGHSFIFLQQAFEKFISLGNTELVFYHRFYREFDVEINLGIHIHKICRTKFIGNKSGHILSLFFVLDEGKIKDFYDVTDVKKILGTVPISDKQILVYPLHPTE